jgi:transposase-like protein
MKMARKPKLTEELIERVVHAILGGNYNAVAARYAGICESTFYRWLQEGEEGNGIKREFSDAVKKAESDAEVRNVALIQTASRDTWQAAAWWLERKHNERWGRKERREVTGEAGGPVEVTISGLLREMTKEDEDEASGS